MSLKDGWQLVIIDSDDKQQKVKEAFQAAGAEDGDAAWIGFENDDGKKNVDIFEIIYRIPYTRIIGSSFT